MRNKDFVERYGLTGNVTHVCHYASHTENTDTVRRLWTIVVEHPHATHGDQCVLALNYDTGPYETADEIDPLDVLAGAIQDAAAGREPFEAYVETWGHYVEQPDGQVLTHHSLLPISLYGRWINECAMLHRIMNWCSSEQMRKDLADIEFG